MPRRIATSGFWAMWLLAAFVGIGAARYFLDDPPLLFRAQISALARHPAWFLLHVTCGIVAIVTGPLQFIASLRASRPRVHRATGYVYLAAVFVGVTASARLTFDTAQFAADALSDTRYLAMVGIAPETVGIPANATYEASQFPLVIVAFAMLSTAWLVTAVIALLRARQHRFDDHRAWMIRSYSVTFAAVTVRLTALPLLLLTRSPVLAITLSFWSWVLNLAVAEWIVRRGERVDGLLVAPSPVA
jgi:hypothetical protein